MSVVAIAIVVSFHLKHAPSELELKMAVCCLALGSGNYMKTVTKYSRRQAIVQTGWKTQSVCFGLKGVVIER
jgi:hypothetical protein